LEGVTLNEVKGRASSRNPERAARRISTALVARSQLFCHVGQFRQLSL